MFGGKGESVALAASAADAQQRFDEIIQLLVAAGYFRARIPALSPFDKVVGGMAWCMTATSVDVDVAFQENATIGQKIKIGEGIERALKYMKCRIPLQAHQIQGLDYDAIFPVVQWLVKQAYAFREEIADATRRLSESSFHQNYQLPRDANLAARRATALPTSRRMRTCYGPIRVRRPKGSLQTPGAAMHARRVLVEFGAQLSVASSKADAPSDAPAASAKRAQQDAKELEGSTEELREGMADVGDADQDTDLSQRRIVSRVLAARDACVPPPLLLPPGVRPATCRAPAAPLAPLVSIGSAGT
jgi:hypothetical protein